MKLWKGKEMEGPDKGIMTLFVKDNYLGSEIVLSMLEESPECKRLYLGAGRNDIMGLWPSDDKTAYKGYKALLKYCKVNKVKIILECSLPSIRKIPDIIWEESDQHIIRIEHIGLLDVEVDDLIKLDYSNNVRMIEINHMIHTDTTELKDDIFPSADIILYNDEEDKK
jgi:hypothetical protein